MLSAAAGIDIVDVASLHTLRTCTKHEGFATVCECVCAYACVWRMGAGRSSERVREPGKTENVTLSRFFFSLSRLFSLFFVSLRGDNGSCCSVSISRVWVGV